ncbi:CBS domain-containing protein [Reinekea sp.]|jgi:acetoin utilization protein AcuB|uniref:CBS domain-containing protein n=1 Tax=Reinekea sp. TaxID=1970455 RepID=UPI002A83784D|nr:CBS domain-containing protein [Reinekea sp.]
MKVKALMTKKVYTVTMDDSLGRVKELFDQNRFHHLLVVDQGNLSGVLSDRDLLKALSPQIDTLAATTRDLACLNKRVHQIMTRKPISLHAEASIRDAIDIFNDHMISCIPILNTEGKPVGILTWRDLMRALATPLELGG